MWIDIKGRLYNLDHISHIVKMVDECESYKKYCIKVCFANEVKIPLGFRLIEFDNQAARDTERTIQNTLSLVVDVNVSKRDPSWGIICYKHHGQNIVHEFNFGNADGETIRQFIKDFESAYRFVDSPPNIRGYF